MGAQPTGRIALLSIKPAYADAIFAGSKTIEFRRSRIAADIDIVLVYATRPVGQVVGWFEVAGVIESTPKKLWRDYSDQGRHRPPLLPRLLLRHQKGVRHPRPARHATYGARPLGTDRPRRSPAAELPVPGA